MPTAASRPQDFWPTSRFTKPAVRSVEKPLVEQISRNTGRLNKKTARLPLPSSPLPEDDDEMEDIATARGDSYGLRDTLFPGQGIHIRFEVQDDAAYDQSPYSALSEKKTFYT